MSDERLLDREMDRLEYWREHATKLEAAVSSSIATIYSYLGAVAPTGNADGFVLEWAVRKLIDAHADVKSERDAALVRLGNLR